MHGDIRKSSHQANRFSTILRGREMNLWSSRTKCNLGQLDHNLAGANERQQKNNWQTQGRANSIITDPCAFKSQFTIKGGDSKLATLRSDSRTCFSEVPPLD